MRTKCYSVRVKSIQAISPRAYKVSSFDGGEDILPSSCIFGQDYEVQRSDAYWIASWILEKKNIQYSTRKVAWFDSETRKMLPEYVVSHHIPELMEVKEDNIIDQLKK